MQRFRGQVAFATVGATDDGDVLNDKEAGPAPIAARDAPHVRTALTTDVAYHTLTCYSQLAVASVLGDLTGQDDAFDIEDGQAIGIHLLFSVQSEVHP